MSHPFRVNASLANRRHQVAQQPRASSMPGFSPSRTPSQPQPAMAAQFQSWVNDKEALERLAKDADRAREALDAQVKQAREKHLAAGERIHAASNELGVAHKQRDMLAAEKAKLEGTLARERAGVEECTEAIEAAREGDKESKRAFCKEVEELNLELGVLLNKRKEARLKGLITVDTVELVLAHHRKQADGSGSPDSQESAGLLQETEEAAALLREKALQHRSAVAEHDKLLEALKEARARVLARDPNDTSPSPPQRLSEADLIELESKWSHEDETESTRGGDKTSLDEGPVPATTDPIHLQIFYDEEMEPSDCDAEAGDDPHLDSTGHHNGTSLSPEQGGAK